jgi:broad specificity phosphatase PhoE
MNAPARRRIYLMRHGEVSYFDENGRPYRPNGVALNDEGRVQAQAAACELQDVPLDRAITSDLDRSLQTAEIVVAGRGLTIETRAELREIQPGRLADIAPELRERAFVGAFTESIQRETRFLAGEMFGSLLDRVLPCVQGLLADKAWRNMLIVAHGGVNRAVLTHALGLGLGGFACFEQDPGCINILDVDSSGRWCVRLINHTPYNAAKRGLELTTMERLYQQYCRRTSADASAKRR